jgi:IS4 transposase
MGLFAHMATQASRGLRHVMAEAVRLIDSTSLRLVGAGAAWAHFAKGVCGAKAHMIYAPEADRPLYLEVTPAKVNDILPARAMPIEPGATYVFDLGYYDFGWWARLDEAGCRLVTRLKSNTPLTLVAEQPLPDGSTLLYDRIGFLPERQASARRNPFQGAVREIGVALESGHSLRLVTNDLDAPAQEIADLYKRRWAVELLFRWIKHTLKIKHFLGRSENAVRIQVAVALIAYLVLRLAQGACPIIESPLAFARLVRANLMHGRSLDQLIAPRSNPAHNSRRVQTNLAPA